MHYNIERYILNHFKSPRHLFGYCFNLILIRLNPFRLFQRGECDLNGVYLSLNKQSRSYRYFTLLILLK